MCQSDDSISIVSPERFVSLRNQDKGTKLFPEAPFSPLKRSEASIADKYFGVCLSIWDNPTRFSTSHFQTIIRDKVSVGILHPYKLHISKVTF